MEQLVQYFSQWSTRQRLGFALGLVGMLATMATLLWLVMSPSYVLLYAGLDRSASGDVLGALDQRAVPYQIKNDAIFVPADQRDALRMALAAEGLPKNSVEGYEILDGLSGFSTTSQMFDAAYWRAKEGELARTIMVSPQITSARVHISHTPSFSFQNRATPKASVAIVTPSGGLSAHHATALRYLVSAAVTGMAPDDVSIIDEQAGLISDPANRSLSMAAMDRSADLRAKVERILEPHLGVGNAVVEVSVDTETQQQSIVQKTIDPKSRVAISTQKVENIKSSENSGASAVSVASNVPDAQGVGQNGAKSQNNEVRETTNYEISQTQSEIIKQPGDIKRITVAVALNQTALAGSDAADLAPQLDKVRALVASAVGLQPERGDAVTVEVLEFQPIVPIDGTAAVGGAWLDRLDVTQIIQVAIAALAFVLIALLVIKPLFARPLIAQNFPSTDPMAPTLTGDIDIDTQTPAKALPSNATERLRQMIGDRQGDTVEILRNWLEEK